MSDAASLEQMSEEEQLEAAIKLSTSAMSDEDQLQAAINLSLQSPSVRGLSAAASTSASSASGAAAATARSATTAEALHTLIFASASQTVLHQWCQQRLHIAQPTDATDGTAAFSAGLAQEQGGPCAILAATQAFMLRRLLFPSAIGEHPTRSVSGTQPPPDASAAQLRPSPAEAAAAIVDALADILWQAAAMPPADGAARETPGGPLNREQPPTAPVAVVAISKASAAAAAGASGEAPSLALTWTKLS